MKRPLALLITLMVLFFWSCAGPDENGTVVLDGPILESINRDGNLEFNGAVVNSGDRPVRNVYVVIMLRDEEGKLLEATSSSVLGEDPNRVLNPLERAFFSISVKSDPQRVVSKDVEIYYDEVDSRSQPSS
ncbi:MAG TPA: FxLYD domain-containing protein [Thermodesulfobacteriota bacterium]|jgi:hypothetical protein|nr:FxLYD domain-containing protein [Thermodesulfobacteriota bacterium]